MERITYHCIKKDKGSCKGCPAFRHMLILIKLNVPYQEALQVANLECVYGEQPELITSTDKNGVTSAKLEGYTVK